MKKLLKHWPLVFVMSLLLLVGTIEVHSSGEHWCPPGMVVDESGFGCNDVSPPVLLADASPDDMDLIEQPPAAEPPAAEPPAAEPPAAEPAAGSRAILSEMQKARKLEGSKNAIDAAISSIPHVDQTLSLGLGVGSWDDADALAIGFKYMFSEHASTSVTWGRSDGESQTGAGFSIGW